MTAPQLPNTELGPALRCALPQLERIVDAAGDRPVFLVGGAVRDILLGIECYDLDLVVEGDATALAQALGGEVKSHERFSTARAELDGARLDIAGARSEAYPAPGALPEVSPGATLLEDLGRRDFTINAMALPLREPAELIDPHGGEDDLGRGFVRVLHGQSFIDDPTRALRAARYAARFGFDLEPVTAELLEATDLTTVSADRRRAELERIAAEPSARRGFELAAEWGLVELRPGAATLLAAAEELVSAEPWSEVAERDRVLLAAALVPEGREVDLAEAKPARPSQAVDLARGASPEELALARALGGEWLDRYIAEWRSIVLEIGGDDLVKAGFPEGPAVGAGLGAALRAKLDGEISGREAELDLALKEAKRALG